MMGRDVFFQTGTDEHGLKVAQAARARDIAPQAFVDELSSYFKEMDDKLSISYDRFIRTSEPAHHRASQAIWEAMVANGDLYLDRYEGWYSVRAEAVAAGHAGRVDRRGKLVLPPVQLSGAFADALSRSAGLHRA
jgi:methionyl-tRNA synthetase